MRAIFDDRCERCGGIIPAACNNDGPIQYCPGCQERERMRSREAAISRSQRTLTGDTRR